MIFGFNTDVECGDCVYHVQTEDRGTKHPVVDSVIYEKGRILDRRRTHYVPGEVTPDQVKEMVTRQHRELVEAIKSGAFVPGKSAPPEPNQPLTVELLNPEAVEQDGRLLFRLRAISGAKVKAFLEINGRTEEVEATAGRDGEAQLAFPLPEAGKATVVFRAVTKGSQQTVKFVVRQQ